jgi:hypothetical protein
MSPGLPKLLLDGSDRAVGRNIFGSLRHRDQRDHDDDDQDGADHHRDHRIHSEDLSATITFGASRLIAIVDRLRRGKAHAIGAGVSRCELSAPATPSTGRELRPTVRRCDGASAAPHPVAPGRFAKRDRVPLGYRAPGPPRENVWVLSDGLACDKRALRQPHHRHRASRAEPGHDAEACGIADSLERPEDLARCRAQARSADRCPRGHATTPGCRGVPTTRKQTSRRRGSGDAI